MKLTGIVLFAVLAIVACGGTATEEEVEVVEAVPGDDVAAVRAMVDEYVLHFNMGHAAMAADYHTDGVFLPADGTEIRTTETRLAWYEAQLLGDPTLGITTDDVVVIDDSAVARGSVSISAISEGEPVSITGNWMALINKVDGNWKWAIGLSNYDTAPPADLARSVPSDELLSEVEDSRITQLMDYYATHFNMGHPGMVASRYTEDAVAAISGRPKMEGRAAIEDDMKARMEEAGNPQLAVSWTGARELGDGFVFGGGRYEMASDSGNSGGAFLVLARAGEDGNLQIQWSASNGLPADE